MQSGPAGRRSRRPTAPRRGRATPRGSPGARAARIRPTEPEPRSWSLLPPMHLRRGDLLSCLALIALALCGFARLVARPGALLVDGGRPRVDHAVRDKARVVGNDLTELFLPHHLNVSARLERHGRFPLWDDSGFGGRPMVGNSQGGLFYPPVWLAWWSRSHAS